MEFDKKFLIIGNQNVITNKEIFKYIKANKIWLGISMNGSNRWFMVPRDYPTKDNAAGVKFDEQGNKYFFVNGVRWFTNLTHKRRNEFLETIWFYKKTPEKYIKYDNYDGIDVEKVEKIPMDYEGVMGVPITFLEKHNPKQFEIVGIGTGNSGKELGVKKNYRGRTDIAYTKNGVQKCPFSRILIQKRKDSK